MNDRRADRTSPPTCCCLDVLHVCCGDLWIVCKAFQAGVSSQHDRRRDQSAERLIYALASLAESATSGVNTEDVIECVLIAMPSDSFRRRFRWEGLKHGQVRLSGMGRWP